MEVYETQYQTLVRAGRVILDRCLFLRGVIFVILVCLASHSKNAHKHWGFGVFFFLFLRKTVAMAWGR